MKTTARFTGDISLVSAYRSNDIAVSRLTEFSSDITASNGFGIKYVASGKERYILGNKTHEVSAGQYLLVNKDQDFECHFKSSTPVEGFCVSLDKEMVSGIFDQLSREESDLLDNPVDVSPEFDGFHQMVYSRCNPLSNYLHGLMLDMKKPSFETDQYELFYDISVQLLRSHRQTDQKIRLIKATRLSTKKELFERLEAARQVLDEEFDQPLKVAKVASLAALSEFHFFRSFKSVYGLSPHQYILQKKLERSAQLMEEGKLSFTEIAYEVGFNDIHAFSKFFRQRYGTAPSKWGKTG
jgi:AraC family transcriptional regulator